MARKPPRRGSTTCRTVVPSALNADAPGTVIHFRKIEIKELPPSKTAEAALPFVILPQDAKAELKFATLAEAVAAAQSGDTIEIRGDGPFVCEPIKLRKKELRIKAKEGFRPVIKLKSAEVKPDVALFEHQCTIDPGRSDAGTGNSGDCAENARPFPVLFPR